MNLIIYTVWTAWISIRVRVRVRVYFILKNLAPPGTSTVHVPTAEKGTRMLQKLTVFLEYIPLRWRSHVSARQT